MEKYGLVKCDFDDPDCCEACREKNSGTYYKNVDGATRCPRHGGPRQVQTDKVNRASAYQIQVWNARLNEMTGYDQVKLLRDEIAIMRMTLEAGLKKHQDADSLLMWSSKMESIILTISKLVNSAERLEKNLGNVMDKPTQFKFASDIITILNNHVEPDVLDEISQQILELME